MALFHVASKDQKSMRRTHRKMMASLAEHLSPDETVWAIRPVSAMGLHDYSKNLGILVLTAKRIVFSGSQGGGSFLHRDISEVEEGRPRFGSSSSILRFGYEGRGYVFCFERQRSAANEYIKMIRELRRNSGLPNNG